MFVHCTLVCDTVFLVDLIYTGHITRSVASSLWDISLSILCFIFRTGPDTVVLNSSEPSKEKEKQGFFRAIKKKKKKSQMVTCMLSTCEDVQPCLDALFSRICPLTSVYILLSPPLLFKCFKHLYADVKSFLLVVVCIMFPCATVHVPLYSRCKSLKEGRLSSRNVFSLCLAQRITKSIVPL